VNDIYIKSNDLKLKNQFDLSIKANDFSYSSFWYYTSVETAKLIIENKSIYINNLDNMNDEDESALHDFEKELVYCLCFCCSNSEKIPMWYLYSGITGNGVSVGLTPAKMLQLIKSINEIKIVDDGTVLHKNEDFTLDYGWVYYRKSDDNRKVKYRNQFYIVDNIDLFEKANYFVKNYPWEYEKEFRVVIKVKESINGKRLCIDIKNVFDSLKYRTAPEFINIGEFKSFLDTQYKKSNCKFNQSALKINMGLLKRNEKSFASYLETADLNYIEYIKTIIDRRNR